MKTWCGYCQAMTKTVRLEGEDWLGIEPTPVCFNCGTCRCGECPNDN